MNPTQETVINNFAAETLKLLGFNEWNTLVMTLLMDVIDLGDSNDEEEEKEEVPKPATKKMNRAAVLRSSDGILPFTLSSQPAKKALVRKKAAAAPAKQNQLTCAPTGRSSHAAAMKARGKMVVDDDDDDDGSN
ncbi:hypothetical protein K443DRAFT_124783 [Laccaria amethystina LaAM-08-1]|uniref:Uncharacterized protein n=1 Tax=Laccaria amethystina LaAM-08-1 TaxID=1095629 RepID=A0A0C9X2Y7_9AGAR|nr:hypothetical protein K443DRAFT_124783 [Laccaria amethystina LaAM-08-1]